MRQMGNMQDKMVPLSVTSISVIKSISVAKKNIVSIKHFRRLKEALPRQRKKLADC